jgi:ubiquitin C-terminal hydrolase
MVFVKSVVTASSQGAKPEAAASSDSNQGSPALGAKTVLSRENRSQALIVKSKPSRRSSLTFSMKKSVPQPPPIQSDVEQRKASYAPAAIPSTRTSSVDNKHQSLALSATTRRSNISMTRKRSTSKKTTSVAPSWMLSLTQQQAEQKQEGVGLALAATRSRSRPRPTQAGDSLAGLPPPNVPPPPPAPYQSIDDAEGVECELVIDDTPSLVASDHLSDSSASSFLGLSHYGTNRLLVAVQPHGLANLGNTCYFNASIQMLLAASKFTNDLCLHDFHRVSRWCIAGSGNSDDDFVKIPSYVVHVIMDGGGAFDAIGNGDYEQVIQNHADAETHSIGQEVKDDFVIVTEDRDEAEDANSSQTNDEEEIKASQALEIAPLAHSFIDLANVLQRGPQQSIQLDPGIDSCQPQRAGRNTYYTDYTNVANPSYFKDQLDAKSDLFYGYYQQDAHEFVVTLLDLLHDEMVDAAKIAVENDKKGQQEEAEHQAIAAKEAAAAAEARAEDEADAAALAAAREAQKKLEHADASISVTPCNGLSCSHQELGANGLSCGLLESVTGMLKEVDAPSPMSHPMAVPALASALDLIEHKSSSSIAQMQSKSTHHVTESKREEVSDDRSESESDSFIHVNTNEVSNGYDADTEEYKAKAGDTTDISDEEEPEKIFLPTDNFHMEVDVQLECKGCEYKRSHKELYNHLSLDIVKGATGTATGTISDALQAFFAAEEMELTCEKCGHATATQRLRIINSPRALLLHVKRFNVEYDAQWRPKVKKNSSRIEFRESLRLDISALSGGAGMLPRANSKPPLPRIIKTGGEMKDKEHQHHAHYSLKSIVHHVGHSANSGHYVTDALHPPAPPHSEAAVGSSATGTSGEKPELLQLKWHRFNDAEVRETSQKEVYGGSSQSTAYLLMYELNGDPSEASSSSNNNTNKKKGWKTIPTWNPFTLSKVTSGSSSRSGRRFVAS